jgi:hypothetical protein
MDLMTKRPVMNVMVRSTYFYTKTSPADKQTLQFPQYLWETRFTAQGLGLVCVDMEAEKRKLVNRNGCLVQSSQWGLVIGHFEKGSQVKSVAAASINRSLK